MENVKEVDCLVKRRAFLPAVIFISFFFQNFSINIGFYLKPYMVLSFLLVFRVIKKGRVGRLLFFEVFFFLFYMFYCYTIFVASDWSKSIRMIFGVLLFLFTYIVYREYFLDKFEEEMLSDIGIIYSVLTLFWYVMGIKHFYLVTDVNPRVYGLFFERGMYRLSGFVNNPDFFNIFNTVFIFYSYKNLKSRKNKFLFLIASLNTLLTLSISAIFSVFVVTVFDFIIFNSAYQRLKKIVLTIILLTLMISIIFVYFQNSVITDIIQKRISHLSTGSGRYKMWKYILNVIYNNFIFGVGINNVSLLTQDQFHIVNAHNTYLEILADSGILIFSLFIFFVLGVLNQAYILAKKYRSKIYIFLSLLGVFCNLFFVSAVIHEGYLFVVLIAVANLKKEKRRMRLKSYAFFLQ